MPPVSATSAEGAAHESPLRERLEAAISQDQSREVAGDRHLSQIGRLASTSLGRPGETAEAKRKRLRKSQVDRTGKSRPRCPHGCRPSREAMDWYGPISRGARRPD